MELARQRFRGVELAGCHEQLADTGDRAIDECVVTETARELEVLVEDLTRPCLLSAHVQDPAEAVAGCRELRLVSDRAPELDRVLVSTQRVRLVDLDEAKGGQRPRRVRCVVSG